MRQNKKQKIVFAFNSYGLGHATRTLPLVQAAIEHGYQTYIIAYGRSLAFLRQELGRSVAKYFALRDYSFNRVFRKKGFSSRRFLLNSPLFVKEVLDEHKAFLKLHAKYKFDLVLSDSRMGIYLPDKPSYFLSNQLKQSTARATWFGEIFTENYMRRVKKHFTKFIVPDTAGNSISGLLTHNFWFLKKKDVEYIGILSMLRKRRTKRKLDYFISISGPEPQRTVFEEKTLAALDVLQGRKTVITLGTPEKAGYHKKIGTVEIFGILNRKQQEEMMNAAALVVTRSGYSTVMDLAELEKKALLIPTDGQPEQEYLARYHKLLGHNHVARLKKLDLRRDLELAKHYPGYKTKHKTADSVKKFLALISQEPQPVEKISFFQKTFGKIYVKIINFLATAAYVGYLPKVPGTWGSLLAVLIYIGVVNVPRFKGFFWFYHWFLAVLFPVSIWVSGEYDRLHQKQDAAEIVIDEVVGQSLTFLLALWLSSFVVGWLVNFALFIPNLILLGMPAALPAKIFLLAMGGSVTLLGFALFRFFDIVKPLGIRQIQKLPRGWGVVLDDVLAGVYAALILTGLYLFMARGLNFLIF
ncbi:MAG: phosphatidylglycerophosphatase A [Candidatus Margulisbacteria bacterium]|jgi:phosphatidylglycerophosphatase A|nr:phosphatidylglycerophosphatase A [Candidatus Margulisiibacteriota bacterium]